MKVFSEKENQIWSKALPGKMSSACLILRSGDKVLMVKAGYKDHWTFPSGIVDENESPKTAALRETKEETGVTITESQCRPFTIIYTASDGSSRDRFNVAFAADVDSENMTLLVPNDEIQEARWVQIKEVAAMSGNKGSYKIFQKFLMDPGAASGYVELFPTTS